MERWRAREEPEQDRASQDRQREEGRQPHAVTTRTYTRTHAHTHTHHTRTLTLTRAAGLGLGGLRNLCARPQPLTRRGQPPSGSAETLRPVRCSRASRRPSTLGRLLFAAETRAAPFLWLPLSPPRLMLGMPAFFISSSRTRPPSARVCPCHLASTLSPGLGAFAKEPASDRRLTLVLCL